MRTRELVRGTTAVCKCSNRGSQVATWINNTVRPEWCSAWRQQIEGARIGVRYTAGAFLAGLHQPNADIALNFYAGVREIIASKIQHGVERLCLLIDAHLFGGVKATTTDRTGSVTDGRIAGSNRRIGVVAAQ